MYIFLGICLLGAVGYFLYKTVIASQEPVNGEEKELQHLESRIQVVSTIMSRHTPMV